MKSLEQLPLPLLEWYRDNARTLPWRSDPTPYHVWISEIMLQQTRVAAVLDYYCLLYTSLGGISSLTASHNSSDIVHDVYEFPISCYPRLFYRPFPNLGMGV